MEQEAYTKAKLMAAEAAGAVELDLEALAVMVELVEVVVALLV